ncbi:MAG: tetratricopeptide repeat protein [Planctomycetota bacterium]
MSTGDLPLHNPTETAQEPNTSAVSTPHTKLRAAPQQERPRTSDADLIDSAFKAGTQPRATNVAAGVSASSQLGRQLWQARISVPEGKEDERIKNELRQIIRQIHSVEFKPRQETTPVIVVKPTPALEPNEATYVSDRQNKAAKEEAMFKPPYEPVSNKTLEVLKDLSQQPDRVGNPFELAEVLFLSGNKKEAVIFYKEALDRKSADNLWSAHDKAWILFQIANCLREDEPQAARKVYARLITEYPDLPWTDLAKARHKLIEWREKDKPEALIDNHIRRDPQLPLRKTEQQ